MASNQKTDRFYYGWVVLVACFIIFLIAMGTRFSFGVFFKSLEDTFGLSRVLTSEIYSLHMLLAALFGIIGGWALDRYGPKVIFIIMGFFTALSLFLTSLAGAPWHLFITYSLLLSIGIGPIYIIAMALASRWFINRRGLAIGIVSSGGGAGLLIMSPIAAWLIVSFGWQTSYLIMALIAFFIMVPSALLLRRAPSEMDALPADERADTGTTDSFEKQSPSQLSEFSLLQAAKTPSFWLLPIINFLLAFCIHLVLTHIVPRAMDLGINPVQAASILSLIGGISIPGRLLMGRASDSIGRKQAMLICILLMVGAMLWLTQSSELWTLYLFAILFGFSYGGITPPLSALTGDIFGLRSIGVIMAITSVGWPIGAAVGPTLAGYIFDTKGNYVLAFIIGMIAILIAAILLIFVRTPTVKIGREAI